MVHQTYDKNPINMERKRVELLKNSKVKRIGSYLKQVARCTYLLPPGHITSVEIAKKVTSFIWINITTDQKKKEKKGSKTIKIKNRIRPILERESGILFCGLSERMISKSIWQNVLSVDKNLLNTNSSDDPT